MHLDQQYTRVKLSRWAADQPETDSPPDLGEVSELVRNTLTKTYDIYPPNLSTEINDDGSIAITAVNPTTKLNIRVTIQNLAGDFMHPGGQVSGVVPPAEGAAPAVPAGGGLPTAPAGV